MQDPFHKDLKDIRIGGGVDTTTPAGRVSVKPMPLSDVPAFGFVIVKLRALVPLRAMLAGVKLLAIVGGAGAVATVRFASPMELLPST